MAIIKFDPQAWTARTAGMPRIVQSVLFDISLYNWRGGTSMPLAHYNIITADLGREQADAIADMLHDAGLIAQDEHGIWSVSAIEEWNVANALSEKRAAAGRMTKGIKKPRRPQQPAKPVRRAKPTALPVDPPAAPPPPAPPSAEDQEAAKKIHDAQEARATLAENVAKLAEAWNQFAVQHGCPQIEKMTEGRIENAAARVREYGIVRLHRALSVAMESGPGRKLTFDAFVHQGTCAGLVAAISEGAQ